MNINEYLQVYRKVDNLGFSTIRPRVKCADGYNVSVQAGRGLYSVPREDADFYEAVELGFPSEADELIMPYAEDPDTPTNTVYGFVSVGVVDQLMEKHGGIIGADLDGKTAFGFSMKGVWSNA